MPRNLPVFRIIPIKATPITPATAIKAIAVAFSVGIAIGLLITNPAFLGTETEQ